MLLGVQVNGRRPVEQILFRLVNGWVGGWADAWAIRRANEERMNGRAGRSCRNRCVDNKK